MRYQIEPIPSDLLPIARSKVIGAEYVQKANYDGWTDVGAILMQAPTSGTLTPTPGYVAPAGGLDMVVRCANGVRSQGALVLTFGVTFADASNGSATATLTPPSWAKDQSFNFPQGMGVDLIGTAGNSAKKITSVNTLTSISNGGYGARFEILSLPDPLTAYFEIACVKSNDPKLPVTKSVAIPCRYDGSSDVKKGRSEPGSLSIASRYNVYGDGLLRLNGHAVSIMTEVWKEDQVLTERYVYENYRPQANPKSGDGDDEAEVTAEGMFERFCIFWPKIA